MSTSSFEVTQKIWRQGIQPPVQENAKKIVRQFMEEQPAIFNYLTRIDIPFNQHEKGIIIQVGTAVWQMMKQSERPLGQVTKEQLQKADQANYDAVDMTITDSPADFRSARQAAIENSAEPAVLFFIVKILMDETEYQQGVTPIRAQYSGLAVHYLKTILDALASALG